MNEHLLKLDAKNRSLRTFLVGLFIDLLVALTLVLVTAFDDANEWGDLEGTLLTFTLFKTAIATVGSYILRRFLDSSRFPTPLPPSPQPEPTEDVVSDPDFPDPVLAAENEYLPDPRE